MNTLTHFNREIQIVVSADEIAAKLLESMNQENPHAILLVNTIIGQAISNDRMNDLGRIYSALNGTSQKVNFKVGQDLYCTEGVYDYRDGNAGHKSREIGFCTVEDVNPLKDNTKVQISFVKHFRDNKVDVQKEWVSIQSLRELNDNERPPVDDREPEEQTGE